MSDEFDLALTDSRVMALMDRRYPGFTKDVAERAEKIKVDIERALAK